MNSLADTLRTVLQCEVDDTPLVLERYSHDASLFELKPRAVVYPRHADDISRLISYVAAHKSEDPTLSVTVRSGGTDMGGGAINDSIVVDVAKYLNHVGPVEQGHVTSEPGVYYRDLQPLTLARGVLLPSYPASKDLCTVGGMVANDSGGEKSLHYGKTHDYVTELSMMLRDGQEYIFRPIKKTELSDALAGSGLQAMILRELYDIVSSSEGLISRSQPQVTKNSAGYNVWGAWDGEVFDPTKIIVGSQGTLGVITSVRFRLVPAKPLSGMVVAFLPSLTKLADVIQASLELQPTSMESFDKHTLKFAFRFFLSFHKTLGWKRFILLGLSFIPVIGKLVELLPKLPELILMVEFEGDTQDEVDDKMAALQEKLRPFEITVQRAEDRKHEEKFWVMRRESFNLLRKNVKRKHTAPFIDDLIVAPQHLPQFLPKLEVILNKYELQYTVAGHMGDGNFHIIPLMDLSDQRERDKIYPVLDEVTDLVLSYRGSLTGEHNDGLIRGPMLERMYGAEMVALFGRIKQVFDPENIFNPHKKTDATLNFSKKHIRDHF